MLETTADGKGEKKLI